MILRAENIGFSYGKDSREIFRGFQMEASQDEIVGLSAPSGFGKTTLCKILAGYIRPDEGEVFLDGVPLNKRKGCCPVQMIWQHPEQAVNPRLRLREVIREGDRVSPQVIQGLGIEEDWLNRFPTELSGGELQRFCIARALGESTRFLLADEISTMLDLITQSQIWNFLLEETKRRKIGVIAVSHSEDLLNSVCTRQIYLEK